MEFISLDSYKIIFLFLIVDYVNAWKCITCLGKYNVMEQKGNGWNLTDSWKNK